MSWLTRLFARRQSTEPREPDSARIGFTGKTLAGVRIDADSAITVPAVWACLRYLSQSVAILPWHVMRQSDRGGVMAPTHPVDWLLWKRPNPECSSFQLRETLTHWALRHGNGYAEIERDTIGRPLALWPIHPDRVKPARDEAGNLIYRVNNGTAGTTTIAAMDMFHIRGFGEGPVGVSVIAYAAESIGWAKAAQLFGAAFLGNGMHVGGVVTTKAPLKPGGLKLLKAELARMFRGAGKAGNWPVLDAGMELKPLAIDPDKGQFILTNQHLVEDICRWFGVPPHKVAHLLRSTNNNIEHQSIEVVQDAILPWVRRFEDEADYKLFGQKRQGFYTKINLMGLLRGDFKSQAEGFRIYREMGVVNADEIRDRIDMNKMPEGAGGEKYTMQGQYTTLQRIGEQAAPIGHNGGPPLEDPAADPPADPVNDPSGTPPADSGRRQIH